MDITLIILSAGQSTRFNSKIKKQWIRVGTKPLWKFVADEMSKIYSFKKIIITANKNDFKLYNLLSDYKIIEGGKTRQQSLKNALKEVDTKYVLVHDVARACVSKTLIMDLINNIKNYDCVVPYLSPTDTVVYQNSTIKREYVKLIQTPQLSLTKTLKKAIKTDNQFTDDRGAIEAIGGKIKYIIGDEYGKKITYKGDEKLPCLEPAKNVIFTGNGYDVHQFEKNKKMFLCGIEIPFEFGFKAHSDGDVAIHSLIDALLGAAGYGDIGEFFPDSDPKYKNLDSKKMLCDIVNLLEYTGYEIVNIDITIIAQTPKLTSYKKEMKNMISKLTNCENTNIKATTNEKLDSIGQKKGVAVFSVANIRFKEER